MLSARGPGPARSTHSCVRDRRIPCLPSSPPRLAYPVHRPRTHAEQRSKRARRHVSYPHPPPGVFACSHAPPRPCPLPARRPTYLTAPNRARSSGRGAHILGRPFPFSLTNAHALPTPPVERRTCIPYVPAVSVTVLYLNHKIPSPCPCLSSSPPPAPLVACFLGRALPLLCICICALRLHHRIFSLLLCHVSLGPGYGQYVCLCVVCVISISIRCACVIAPRPSRNASSPVRSHDVCM